MKNVFERIRRAALPFQDKRDDEGHAETVVEFAEILCKLANTDRDIVIPAAILHDIGWSRVPKEEALKIFPKDIPEEEKMRIKKMHEKEGALLARQILSKENYDAKKIGEILGIVSGHDTREGFLSENEKALASDLEDIKNQYDKIVIAFSFFTTQIWDVERILNKIKRDRSDKLFFLSGGPHPSGDPRGTLKMGFDAAVIGEGEEAVIELLEKIGQGEDCRTAKGLGFLDQNEKYCFSGKRTPLDLDDYPPFAVKHKKFGPIEISRGCSFACRFCQTSFLFGASIRHRSVENICKYVKIMNTENMKYIRFTAPNVLAYGSNDGKKPNLPELKRLLSGVRNIIGNKKDIFIGSFPSEARPEQVTPECLRIILKYANNDNLIIGAQSGSQRMLDLCHRGHTVKDVFRAVRLTTEAGLEANVDFIFGLPGETKEDVRLTLEVMSRLVDMGARIHAHAFMPLVGTPFANMPAGKVAAATRKAIGKLIPRDIVYGDWQKQEQLAKKIEKYISSRGI